MVDNFGPDYINIEDSNGTEYELMVISRLDYNGNEYVATIPSIADSRELIPEILIFKTEEDEDDVFVSLIEDEQEYEAVNELFLEKLFAENEEE